MAKPISPVEQVIQEPALKISDQAVNSTRETCEKTKINMFEQLGQALEAIEESQQKAGKRIAEEYAALNPVNYKYSADESAPDALEVLKKHPATGFEVTIATAEDTKKVFAKLPDEIVEGFLSLTYISGNEAASAATKVAEEINTLFGFYADMIEKNQLERKQKLNLAAENLIASAYIPKQKYSTQMKDDFYSSTAYMLYERTLQFADKIRDVNTGLEKEENEQLAQMNEVKGTVINAVLMPYVGMHFHFENEAKISKTK